MADSDKDSNDGASIKPVSSLRSHFESISSASPAPSNRSSRGSPRFGVAEAPWQREHNTAERTSLDLPRRTSPWLVAKETHDSRQKHGNGAMGPPVTPRSERPRSALLQRSSSARPLSPTLVAPVVTIDSPKSPPKSAHLPKTHHFPPPASPNTTAAGELRSRAGPPVPPHSVNRLSHSGGKAVAQAPDVDQKLPEVHSPAPVRKTNAVGTIDTALANVPPPINRAEKPKVPAKPGGNKLRPSPDPEKAVSNDRASPFSTPPSSDDSPSLTANGSPYLHHQSTSNNVASVDKHFGSPSPIHPASKKPDVAPNIAHSTPRYTNALSQTQLDMRDTIESRPGLPPRRMTEQRPPLSSVTTYNKARVASTSRLPASRAQIESQRTTTPSRMPKDDIVQRPDFPPPPQRSATIDSMKTLLQVRRGPSPTTETASKPSYAPHSNTPMDERLDAGAGITISMDYPDASESGRKPPRTSHGVYEIDTNYDTRLFGICGDCICTAGYFTRAWDLITGNPIMSLSHGEQTKITALAFKPGATADQEGQCLWLGTNYGELMEVDIASQSIVASKTSAHNRREVVRIHRHQNSMWSLDDGGNLNVWLPDNSGLPSMQQSSLTRRVPKGHSFSLVVHHHLWLAAGKDIRVFQPSADVETEFQLTLHPLSQPSVGEVTSGAVISNQLDRVYFGHTDGKVTIYSTVDFACLGVVNVSVYKINALAGAGDFLWAGYNTGMIYVYDTRTQPWTTKKDWHAHSNPVANILVDRSSIWRSGVLQVASIGTDNALRLWDGMLEEDWLEMRTLVVTWNAGAATPGNLRYEDKDSNFFRDVLHADEPPDILVFGFQELVDLEDKKLTAKSLFKGNKKKDPSEQEHMSRQYRAWRDHLVRTLEDSMPSSEPFHLLHTASMVGLFSCVFVRASLRNRITSQSAAEIKRGMGGLHGNKGCLILRFLIDDSSLCLVNCHLAAGQTQTVHRNNDISAILESTILPAEQHPNAQCDSYSGGGDGSMILDHEICILNGDLNYRIDTMGRDTVVKAIQAGNFTKLLERDQLLVSRRRNPLFRLKAFTESPITFAPTYKYDVGTDRYDTSEKHRAPAWCDRILYRGAGKIKQLEYRRHELRVSDHRPVSATFKMRIKSVSHERRPQAWKACLRRFEGVREELARNAKIIYLRDVLGVNVEEAKTLV
ncbi:MAG: hypothetical protein Q9191_003124 [Dirinaria sp. TL-2023a]